VSVQGIPSTRLGCQVEGVHDARTEQGLADSRQPAEVAGSLFASLRVLRIDANIRSTGFCGRVVLQKGNGLVGEQAAKGATGMDGDSGANQS